MTIPSAADLDVVSSRISHSVVMVDAETARRWLTHNKKNRTVSEVDVAKYRADMAAGRWQFAGDPIRFDVEGNLNDGQHRLFALSELDDVTIPMLVIRGLPIESQKVMDQGRKRTPGQQLSLLGVKDANLTASITKQVILWESGLMFRDHSLHRMITTAAIEDYVAEHHDDMAYLAPLFGICRAVDAPPSIVGTFAIIAGRQHPDDTTKFLKQLHSMVGLSEGHPVHTLDRRLRNIRKNAQKVSNRDYLALFIQAFNAYRAGRKLATLPRPKNSGWTRENFPEPK
ncbi:MAG: hypothetical protein QM658_03235 [Gordonia sp. (in: high G+C Gram-positive bacteria)]